MNTTHTAALPRTSLRVRLAAGAASVLFSTVLLGGVVLGMTSQADHPAQPAAVDALAAASHDKV